MTTRTCTTDGAAGAVMPAPSTPPRAAARLAARMRRTADGPLGPVVVACWAVAEAFVFPLIPDSGLAGMTFASPRRARRLWVGCVLGTVAGSVAAAWLVRHGVSWPLPLVTERMSHAAGGWVAADGAAALAHQPLSGVPVKAFNATGAPDVSLLAWGAWIAVARGGRMAVTAGLGALAGRARDRWVPAPHRATVHVAVVGVATVGLLGSLVAIVQAWT